MDAREEINRLLKEHGAVLLREKKHLVYKLSNGKQFTMAKTPRSDGSWFNHLADLRRALGISGGPSRIGERREKRHKPGRAVTETQWKPAPQLNDWRRDLGQVKRQIVDASPWWKRMWYRNRSRWKQKAMEYWYLVCRVANRLRKALARNGRP